MCCLYFLNDSLNKEFLNCYYIELVDIILNYFEENSIKFNEDDSNMRVYRYIIKFGIDKELKLNEIMNICWHDKINAHPLKCNRIQKIVIFHKMGVRSSTVSGR